MLRAASSSVLLALLLALASVPAVAQTAAAQASVGQPPPDLWFAGTRLILERAVATGNEIAVSTSDAGLVRFLGRLGATLSYDPAQRYVVVTTADRRVIRFTIGDARYSVNSTFQIAPFTPYTSANDAVLPFYTLARALAVEPVRDGADIVLEPQLYVLDVKTGPRSITTVTLRTATAARFRRVGSGTLVLAMGGVASALDRTRRINADALSSIDIASSGSPRNPTTLVSFSVPAGAAVTQLAGASPYEVVLSFTSSGPASGVPVPLNYLATPAPYDVTSGASAPLQGTTAAGPASSAAPYSSAAPAPAVATPAGGAIVTAVDQAVVGDGLSVRIAVNGGATFEWHRLPDGRFYVDVKNATLAFPPRDEGSSSPLVTSLRVKQVQTDPIPIVRVALTLALQRQVQTEVTDGAIVLTVGSAIAFDGQSIGAGEVNGGLTYVPPSPAAPVGPAPAVTMNGRLIVIDPGHGGSDAGAQHNGLTEKDLTLSISERLRVILIARGWNVQMTRDSDADVYAPNDSARDELQARCDLANNAGARIFLSIHVNSSVSTTPNGTTTYYYKAEDYALARAVHKRLIGTLGTTDDGVRKEAFYVIRHTTMPAILVETAFMSNAADSELLHSSLFLQRVAQAVADGVGDYAASGPNAQ